MIEAPKINTPHPDVEDMSEHWDLPRSLYDGTHEMREKGKKYLPKEEGESEDAYKARLNRTVLFNGFGKTVQDMAGRVFAKEIMLGEDVPPALVPWCENVDLTGQHINVFANSLFLDSLQVGIAHILVDTPTDPGTNRANGGRPYFVHLKAEDIIGWTNETTPDGVKLTSLRFYECVEETEGLHVSRIEQIRVLLPYAYEIWRKSDDAKKEWQLYVTGARDVEYIPLSTIYLRREGFMVAEPPLLDLADLNVMHWQSSSDQRNILHVARVPILYGAGFQDEDQIVVGSGVMTRNSDPTAKLQYVEHSGKAIASGREDLKDIEYQMQMMGLQLLVSQPGQSATGEVRDDIKENSRLSMWADALKDCLENALSFMADMGGVGPDGGSVVVNKDFGISARAATDIQSLITAYTSGLISAETAIKEFIRRGFLSDDVDPQGELEAIADDAINSTVAGEGMQDAALPNTGAMPTN